MWCLINKALTVKFGKRLAPCVNKILPRVLTKLPHRELYAYASTIYRTFLCAVADPSNQSADQLLYYWPYESGNQIRMTLLQCRE